MIRSKYIKIIIAGICILVGGGIAYYFYHVPIQQVSTGTDAARIVDFDDARDTDDIVKLFEENRYWLTTSNETSIAYLLKNRTPSKNEPQYAGTMEIKVLRDNEGFKGFVTYYKQNFYTAQLLFLAVPEKFRGRGYAQKLMDYALDDLKKMGVSNVWLVTRTNNTAAQKVYKRIGLQETSRDDGFVYFAKALN